MLVMTIHKVVPQDSIIARYVKSVFERLNSIDESN